MSWETQGRQGHGWFGHGTAPTMPPEAAPAAVSGPGCLFDPLSVGQRIDYAAGCVIGEVPRHEREQWEREQWENRLGGAAGDKLKTAVAVWYAASALSRDAFRQRLLNPFVSDETVDGLRRAARGIVEARTHAQLGAAGGELARAAERVGVYAWPRFLDDAVRRAVAAVSGNAVPGVVQASASGTDMATGVAALGLVLLFLAVQNHDGTPKPGSKPAAGPPSPTGFPATGGQGASSAPSVSTPAPDASAGAGTGGNVTQSNPGSGSKASSPPLVSPSGQTGSPTGPDWDPAQPPQRQDPKAGDKLDDLLSNYQTRRYKIDNQTFQLDKSSMRHMLKRHSPEYWDGSTKIPQCPSENRMSGLNRL